MASHRRYERMDEEELTQLQEAYRKLGQPLPPSLQDELEFRALFKRLKELDDSPSQETAGASCPATLSDNPVPNQKEPDHLSASSMNRRQWACILFGFLLLVLSLLFVPTRWRGPYNPVSYSFLFTGRGSIDFARLFVEWVLIALVTSVSFLLQAKRPTLTTEQEPGPLASDGPTPMKGGSFHRLEAPGLAVDTVVHVDDGGNVTWWDNGKPTPLGETRKEMEAKGGKFRTAVSDDITRHTGLENSKTYHPGKLWQRKFVIPMVAAFAIFTIGIAYYGSRRIGRDLPTTENSRLAGGASITNYGRFEWNAYNGSDFVLTEVRVSISVFDEKGNAVISNRVYRVPAFDFYPQQTKQLSTDVGFTLGQGQRWEFVIVGARGRPE